MDHLKRSTSNPGALLNTNNDGLDAYKRAREQLRKAERDHQRIEKMEGDLFNLKHSINNIEKMLKKVLEGKDN